MSAGCVAKDLGLVDSKPLLVLCCQQPAARQGLRELGCDVVRVPSLGRLVTTEYRRPPRLFVIEAAELGRDRVEAALLSLRRERPLTEVLIWAPAAEGEFVRAMFRAGSCDVVVSDQPQALVAAAQETLKSQKILPRVNDLSRQRSRSARFESLLSRSQAMWDLFDLCTRIGATDATVLIVGETGTGKELLARAIHRQSGRSGRFVPANCASIPRELIDSELFGHEKGAFTGAHRAKTGLVTHAHEGTLFLDEIGDMAPEGQQSLLRMLQERRIRPVGSLVETEVDVRVVAATNVPLDDAVQSGDFREDLFYRLDVIRMNVPPLRDRPEDILFLFGHFTKQLSKHYGVEPPSWTDGFLNALVDYRWPGNVRQLQNVSERLVLSRRQRPLTAADFARLHRSRKLGAPSESARVPESPAAPTVNLNRTLQQHLEPAISRIEEDYLRQLLKKHQGKVAATANQAGISRRTLLRKMKAYGIDKRRFK